MNILKLELKKSNIKPYCWIATAIFICLMGLIYIFAQVPHLASGDKNAALLFSSYEGIFSISGAIALMAFSILAASMGFRYVICEYSGANGVLLFTYPVNRKAILWAKIKVISIFMSAAMILTVLGSLLLFSVTNLIFPIVDDDLQFTNVIQIFTNTLVVTLLANAITLLAIRIGFLKKSNSTTIVVAVIGSMLMVNLVSAINTNFFSVLLLTVLLFVLGILLTINLAEKINCMQV